MPRKRPRDKFGTSQKHPGRLGRFQTQGAECPRDRRDIWRDRWDMSMGQTGHTPGGVPPKFCMFIVFFCPPKQFFLGSIFQAQQGIGSLTSKLVGGTDVSKYEQGRRSQSWSDLLLSWRQSEDRVSSTQMTRGHLKFPNDVIRNALGCRKALKTAKDCKRAQKSASASTQKSRSECKKLCNKFWAQALCWKIAKLHVIGLWNWSKVWFSKMGKQEAPQNGPQIGWQSKANWFQN